MFSKSAQLELCYAYGRAVTTYPLDVDAFHAIMTPNIKLSFLPLSFGAPTLEGIDSVLGAIQHLISGLTDLEYVIDKNEVIESEGRVWYFTNYSGKNHLGETFDNQIITRTRMTKCEDGKLRFTEISEYVDPEAEKIMARGGEETATAAVAKK